MRYAQTCCSLLLLVAVTIARTSATEVPASIKQKYESYLPRFENKRAHVQDPNYDYAGHRNNVTEFMKSKFEAAGLTTYLQHFSTDETNNGQTVNGTNLIAVLPGNSYRQAGDEVIVFAAHLDTYGRHSMGVNNDGSGLVALTTIAEEMGAGKTQCDPRFTVVFAAFDRSETANIDFNPYCNKSCGSIAFIKSLSTYIGSGTIKLTLVMDCITNFDSFDNRQDYPASWEKYSDLFIEAIDNKFLGEKGDFLAVAGRNNEQQYLAQYKSIFKTVRLSMEFKIFDFQWPVTGALSPENRTTLVDAFKDGDYISFWDANLNAILLTDTCYHRGYMRGSCKTNQNCDNYMKISSNPEKLKFMYSTANAAMTMVNTLTCDKCRKCHAKAVCLNQVCSCSSGYTGNGTNCTDINECSTSPCKTHSTCRNTDGSYQCPCNPGYEGDGKVECKVASSATSSLPSLLSQVALFFVAFLLTQLYQ